MAKAAACKADQKAIMQSEGPDFLEKMIGYYRGRVAHAFIMHGNVHDYCDNAATHAEMSHALAQSLDSNVQKIAIDQAKKLGLDVQMVDQRPKILAYFSIRHGLKFAHADGRAQWERIMEDHYKTEFETKTSPVAQLWKSYKSNSEGFEPLTFGKTTLLLDLWFNLSELILSYNREAKDPASRKIEITFTITFFQSDLLFNNAKDANQTAAIGRVRNWALDATLGQRNRIILCARYLSDIEESIRSGDSAFKAITVRRPNLEERVEYLNNFNRVLRMRANDGKPVQVSGHSLPELRFAPDFGIQEMSNLSAGLSRKQIEAVIMSAEVSDLPVSGAMVSDAKRLMIEEEFGGSIDFVQATYGFDQIGGHEGVKRYMKNKVIDPMRNGDRNACTSGVLLVGPAGTAKTELAKAAAYECKNGMNVIMLNFSKLYGGVVGQTEKNLKRVLEAIDAAAPCIVVADELDSSFSGGRQSTGDSGVQARMFNGVMQWLSDPGRKGRIVFIGISNRPDLLDAAFIRAERIDAILPMLPPAIGDVKGRSQILSALARKQGLEFDDSLRDSISTPGAGIGRLLHDQRIWTGAEMSVLLKEAKDNAREGDRKKISAEDWENAFDCYIPSTRDVEVMTGLALEFCNNLKYLPPEWREQVKTSAAKASLATSLKANYGVPADNYGARD